MLKIFSNLAIVMVVSLRMHHLLKMSLHFQKLEFYSKYFKRALIFSVNAQKFLQFNQLSDCYGDASIFVATVQNNLLDGYYDIYFIRLF